MAFGVTAPGPVAGRRRAAGPGRYRTRAAYLDAMRALVAQGELDILLTSASNGERLAADGSLDDEVTLAVRANDTTDIWNHRGSSYTDAPSRPFRTADLAASGRSATWCSTRSRSTTTSTATSPPSRPTRAFRREAAERGHAALPRGLQPQRAGRPGSRRRRGVRQRLRSCARWRASPAAHRPLFLKMPYNGADALAELVEHDPSVVVGILGGSAGTTRDTFELLHRAAAARRPGGAVRAQDPARGVAAGPRRPDAPGAARRALPRRRRARLPRRAGQGRDHALPPLQDDLEVTDPVLRSE